VRPVPRCNKAFQRNRWCFDFNLLVMQRNEHAPDSIVEMLWDCIARETLSGSFDSALKGVREEDTLVALRSG
jgi:hypothetical protein